MAKRYNLSSELTMRRVSLQRRYGQLSTCQFLHAIIN